MAIFGTVEKTLKTGKQARLRSAIPADAARLLEIRRIVVEEGDFMLTEPDEFDLTVERMKKSVQKHLREPGYLYLIVEVDGWLVGMVHFANGYLHRTAHAGMLSIYVDQPWRGQGVGQLLLEGLISWSERSPLIEKLSLAVFSTNLKAMGLYEKMGFRIEGRCPRDMKLASGDYIDSVLMYRFVDDSQKEI
jgi:RimJ/RimL family protein N-acetyltransferase